MSSKRVLALVAVLIVTLLLGCPDPITTPAVITPMETVVDIAVITGVTAPVFGATPVTTITETDQYTGTVIWNGSLATFEASTVYAATITLTAKAGYTLAGVEANFFTVAGAATTNPVNSGVITAVFPATSDGSYTSANIGTLKYVAAGTFNNGKANMTVSSFRISQYEVTRAQFLAIMGSDPSNTTYSSGVDNPVQMVNWYHAIAFCNKLSLAEGLTPVYSVSVSSTQVNWSTLTYASIPTTNNADWNDAEANWSANGYRLPTEAEWQFAARGGNNSNNYTYAGSNTVGNVAWYSVNAGSTTHTVGTKAANELGLCDMSGNVWEWCWDWYAGYPGAATDYHGAASGSDRVQRGGSWSYSATYCTVAARSSYDPCFQGSGIGFRVVRL